MIVYLCLRASRHQASSRLAGPDLNGLLCHEIIIYLIHLYNKTFVGGHLRPFRYCNAMVWANLFMKFLLLFDTIVSCSMEAKIGKFKSIIANKQICGSSKLQNLCYCLCYDTDNLVLFAQTNNVSLVMKTDHKYVYHLYCGMWSSCKCEILLLKYSN